MELQSPEAISVRNFSGKWQLRSFGLPSLALDIVAKAPRVVGGSPVFIRLISFSAEVMRLVLRNRRQLKMWFSFRGLKALRVSGV